MNGLLCEPGPWEAERCKRCGRRNVIGFSVPDEIWMKVVNCNDTVLCPACFDEEAQRKSVKYRFLELFPVTWNT